MEWSLTKHDKQNTKIQLKNKKKEQFRTYLEEMLIIHPHIVPFERIIRMNSKLNIDNLKTKLLSKEWIDYQARGWKYVKIVKNGHEPFGNDQNDIFSLLDLENKWGDCALFKWIY